MSLDWWAWVRASVLVAALAVSGCQTTGESDYTEWEDILEPQSMLEVKALQNTLYYVTRKRRTSSSRIQEAWRWTNGELFVADLYPGSYYNLDFDDPGFLVEYGARWRTLKKLGVVLRPEKVRVTTDSRNNRVPYAVVNSENDKVVCFVAARATWLAWGGDRPVTANPIGGYVQLYQCEKTAIADDVEAFTRDGLDLINDIDLRK